MQVQKISEYGTSRFLDFKRIATIIIWSTNWNAVKLQISSSYTATYIAIYLLWNCKLCSFGPGVEFRNYKVYSTEIVSLSPNANQWIFGPISGFQTQWSIEVFKEAQCKVRRSPNCFSGFPGFFQWKTRMRTVMACARSSVLRTATSGISMAFWILFRILVHMEDRL